MKLVIGDPIETSGKTAREIQENAFKTVSRGMSESEGVVRRNEDIPRIADQKHRVPVLYKPLVVYRSRSLSVPPIHRPARLAAVKLPHARTVSSAALSERLFKKACTVSPVTR